ncbi:MAG: SusD/RagB family nutrient-binding outer membrane lipoprotein [Bacteroidota bacterium]
MKYIKIFLSVLVVIALSTGCQDRLDINTDPLVASTADPNVLLPFVLVQYSNRHTTELGTRIMDVPQHFSACFNSPRAGNTSSFLTGNTWDMYYTRVLGNLVLVENDAVAQGELSNNVNAIAKILKAKSFFELACIWDAVPFTEALDGAAFPTPNFDEQEVVFRGAVDLLDQAIGLIDATPESGSFDVTTGDLIFEGDMDKWRRWANTLKLRILMLIRNKDTSVDSEIVATLGQPLIEENSQAALLEYFDTPAESNGYNRLVEAFFGVSNEVQEVYAPGEVLYDLLSAGDPRFGLMIADPNDEGSPGNGQFAFSVGGATIADNVIRNDIPHIMALPSEVHFYKAELALLGVTSDDAQAEFTMGVRKILEFWGQDIPGAQTRLSSEDISNFVDGLPTADLQAVQEQLYLESFLRPVYAWNTVRRTKVPALVPPPAANISFILKRFNYPPDEVASNPNAPVNLDTDTPVWFEN